MLVVFSLSGLAREGALLIVSKNGRSVYTSTSVVEGAEFGVGWSK
jgi:hypothetical protein